MRIAFLLLLAVHGLIHLLGFVKAFGFAPVEQLTQNISKPAGILWLLACALFLLMGALYFFKNDAWWMAAAAAVLLSQILIVGAWQDARFGSIANAIVLLVVVTGYGAWSYRRVYEKDVQGFLQQSAGATETLLTEADLQPLPAPVQRYLRYTGAVGRPKVRNFKITFVGQIRKDEQSAWMPFTSEQYNFPDAAARLFFMKATMKQLPVAGYHRFVDGDAFMDIRLFSLFRVQYQTGREMGIAETVTFFNDMCCMAPATLIDKRVKWLKTDGNTVEAAFTNNGITIGARLYFNDQGELVNFISDDRYAAADDGAMRRLRWATPLKDYRSVNGYRLAGYADAVYTYPEGDLAYGNFRLTAVQYNCK